MAKNQTKTKSRPKKHNVIGLKHVLDPSITKDMISLDNKPKTYVSIGSETVQDQHGMFWGDAVVVQNLPTADRAELARHLVAVAGNLLSTVGDPISGATIVILTRRADG